MKSKFNEIQSLNLLPNISVPLLAQEGPEKNCFPLHGGHMFYINQVHMMLAGKYRAYIALLPIKIFNSTGTLPTARGQILNQNFLYEASYCPTNKSHFLPFFPVLFA